MDACGDAARLVRDLKSDTRFGASLGGVKLFSSKNAFHSIGVGTRTLHTETYQQNQIQLKWSTVRNIGPYTAIKLSFGQPVLNQLSLRRSLHATLRTSVLKRGITTSFSYSDYDNGRFFGIDHHETLRRIDINYDLTRSLSVSLGYNTVTSSIGYFNERWPTVSLLFAPFRF